MTLYRHGDMGIYRMKESGNACELEKTIMTNDDDWKRHIEITEDMSYVPYDNTIEYKGKSISIECIVNLLSTMPFCAYKTLQKDGTAVFTDIHTCPHCKGDLSAEVFEEVR